MPYKRGRYEIGANTLFAPIPFFWEAFYGGWTKPFNLSCLFRGLALFAQQQKLWKHRGQCCLCRIHRLCCTNRWEPHCHDAASVMVYCWFDHLDDVVLSSVNLLNAANQQLRNPQLKSLKRTTYDRIVYKSNDEESEGYEKVKEAIYWWDWNKNYEGQGYGRRPMAYQENMPWLVLTEYFLQAYFRLENVKGQN